MNSYGPVLPTFDLRRGFTGLSARALCGRGRQDKGCVNDDVDARERGVGQREGSPVRFGEVISCFEN
jgi:hypothetical protein